MEKFFSDDGVIAKNHKEFEYRKGQEKMALAVMNAFEERRHLLVEAGTGTGKTLAYLIPAVAAALAEKRRIVISTGTKNLQEQLMQKDVPFVQKIMPKKFKAAYMKGRSNYACIYRIRKAEMQPILEGMADLDHFDTIREWLNETETGDRAELTSLPENLSFWNRINAKSDSCIGQKCPDFEQCFVTKMRVRAEEADIVVVNHHLFFADLNVRGNKFGRVLPDYGAVVFDEAHLIEDIASDYFGFQVSNFQIDELLRDADSLPLTDVATLTQITKLTTRISGFAEQFWTRFTQGRGAEGRFPLEQTAFYRTQLNGQLDKTPLGEAYLHFDGALDRLEKEIDIFAEETPEVDSVVRRIRQTRFDLEFIVKQSEHDFVYWMERRGRGIFLRSSPIDVSKLLGEKLFDAVESVVLTSATLSSSGKFDFIKQRLGLPAEKTDTLNAPSSFNFEQQALVYIPNGMPDPRSPEFTQIAANEIIKILEATDGRAFVLCTSNASMNALYELVSRRVKFPCFVQGTMSKTFLLNQFKKTPHAVLFATSSFWQGVDVRGEQLSCVIIDKLPFAVPSDPIVAARTKFIDENGGKSFFDYSVPQAVISLKQGIGRLIRSKTDKGIIALLDPRLRTKSYGRDFLVSLPKMRIITDIGQVSELFVGERISDQNC